MEFEQFRNLQRVHVANMLSAGTTLFTVSVNSDVIWNTYLDSFPPGTNEVFRQRREFDCSCCRHFIKSFGNVVAVKNGLVVSIWGFESGDPVFQPVIDALDKLVTSAPIDGVFVSKEAAFGTDVSRELRDGNVTSWRHFYIALPGEFVYRGRDTLNTVTANYRTNKELLQRSLDQISIEATEMVLDLISQNSLYRGEEWKGVLEKFLGLQKEYTANNNWLWVKSVEVGPVVGRIKNHSIGTLLLDLSGGEDLDVALRKYEAVVAPTSYKRPQAIFTKKMIEDAQRTVIELGLENSLGRRFARLDDVSVNDVLFADRSAVKRMIGGDAFGKLTAYVLVTSKQLERVEEVPIERFITDVLPRAASLAVLVENKHQGNLVSLIAPLDANAPGMFKWGNNFSWAYGNLADSMKERVARAGGKVDGVLRFSIQWNDDGDCPNDFDAHCIEPNGNRIYFGNKRVTNPSSGMLDVDIISPGKDTAVENITWTDINKMREGVYEFSVHCFSHRGGRSGFAAEIEYNGEVSQFEYRKNIPGNDTVVVARVKFSRRDGLEIVESLPSAFASREVWGITTNQFAPVLGVMYSPNYWQENAVGNRHVIFALKGCVNDNAPNGFFNEYLKEDLMKHKRVFEALGKEMRVEKSNEQLSGLGFATTKRASLVVKVIGSTERVIRVTF